MKILEPGRPQKGWSIKRRCTGSGNGGGGCGAQLLVEFDDLFVTQSGHYDGSTDYYTTFACAACGVWTDLPEGRGPPERVTRPAPPRRSGPLPPPADHPRPGRVLAPGTRVQTTYSQTPDRTWNDEIRAARRWGVVGTILQYHDGHGLCYVIRHDDGAIAAYDPTEFIVLSEPAR